MKIKPVTALAQSLRSISSFWVLIIVQAKFTRRKLQYVSKMSVSERIPSLHLPRGCCLDWPLKKMNWSGGSFLCVNIAEVLRIDHLRLNEGVWKAGHEDDPRAHIFSWTVILKGNIAFYKSNFCCTAFSALMHTYTFSWDCTYCLENETPELCAGLWSNLVEALYFGIIPCMSYFFFLNTRLVF